ncbi:polysaccharide deacetylase family protein [Phormidium sp. CCY1219]|uniref:polysaccharide deacetylase family protein n=1 Tax=Phormidium sp. CCY1219 TaxID=2886104 RepID=UPI002D1F88B7|nr:polysaccharide deacetylase family protein [Phormidium sp. CCY1219]MEB3827978.1 polysaccharide deacetylase family protein [Phormidium sp. CCY1219]
MPFAPLYPIVYRILKPCFGSCLWSGSETEAQIALTFDDGPHPQYTPELLEVLDEFGIEASFFWLGVCVERSPQVAKAVYERGHWIGLHGYEHRSFPRLSARELHESLTRTQRAIAKACHLDPQQVNTQMRDVRPPNGLFVPKTLEYLQRWNYRPVMWSVVVEDWWSPGVSVVVQRVLQQVQNGSHIVLHDGCYGGADVAKITAQLIPELLQRGYQFVTLDRLWHSLKSPNVSGAKAP